MPEFSAACLAHMKLVSTATLTTQMFKRGLSQCLHAGRPPARPVRRQPGRPRLHAAQHPRARGSGPGRGLRQSRPSAAQGDRERAAWTRAGDRLPRRHPGRVRRPDPGDPADGARRGRRWCPTAASATPVRSARWRLPVFCAGPSAPLNLAHHHAVEIDVPIGCGGVAVYPGRPDRRRRRRRGGDPCRIWRRRSARDAAEQEETGGVPVVAHRRRCRASRHLSADEATKAAFERTGEESPRLRLITTRRRAPRPRANRQEGVARMDYVPAGGLQGRNGSEGFRRARGDAGHRRRRPRNSGSGFGGLVRDLAPREPVPAGAPRHLASADRRLARRKSRQADRAGRPMRNSSRHRLPAAGTSDVQSSPRQASMPRSPALPGRSWWCRSTNARYALNAGNARWGSLYDALYGTDAIPEDDGATRGRGYNPVRGARVVAKARRCWTGRSARRRKPCRRHRLQHHRGQARRRHRRPAASASRAPEQFVGYHGDAAAPAAILLKHNGLHLEIVHRPQPSDRPHRPGGPGRRGAGIRVTTIMDCEDCVAAVDADDKVAVYRNWLGLMNGTLSATFRQRRAKRHPPAQRRPRLHRSLRRHRHPARAQPDAGAQCRPSHVHRCGAATTPAPRSPKAILDAAVTSLIAMHDLRGHHADPQQPGWLGLHRQAEDARAGGSCFRQRPVRARRRPSGPAAQHAEDGHHGRGAAHHAQPRRPASMRRASAWCSSTPAFSIAPATRSTRRWTPGRWCARTTCATPPGCKAYEDNNVDVGLACGLRGRAQIGKGMWAAPDRMADMLEQKIGHPARRREHRLGALAHRRDPACAALPRGRCRRATDRARRRARPRN